MKENKKNFIYVEFLNMCSQALLKPVNLLAFEDAVKDCAVMHTKNESISGSQINYSESEENNVRAMWWMAWLGKNQLAA